MDFRTVFALGAVAVVSCTPAFACDPIADEKAFIAMLADRHFSESQLQQFLGRSELLRQEISRAIAANDDPGTCEKIAQVIAMLRDFGPG